MKKLLLVGLVALALSACGGGSDGTSSSSGGTSSDLQSFQQTVSGTGSANNYFISGEATGCRSVGSNGTCSVQMTYSGTGTYAGSVSLSPTTGYTTTVSNCAAVSATQTQCTFTITNSGTIAKQSLEIMFGGTGTGAVFTFG